jgi:hypothetical protein
MTVSFVSLWLTNGSSVVGGSVGAMIVGQLGIGVYAILFALLVPFLGIAGGAAAALAVAILTVSLPTFFGLRARGEAVRKLKASASAETELTDESQPNEAGIALIALEEEQPQALDH